jgi:hypothetical protein
MLRFMEELKLNLFAPIEEQLRILVPYLEEVAKGSEKELKLDLRSAVLIQRYLRNWEYLYAKGGLTPKGALLYYKRLVGK